MDGVVITELKKIETPKGDVLHAIKKSESTFLNFGEAYFSSVKQNDIKGWKRHRDMTLNIVVPLGEIEFVIYDEKNKEFFSIKLSKNNYKRLTVNPGLWMAFRGVQEENMLLNIANIEHDKNEAENIELKEIEYEW